MHGGWVAKPETKSSGGPSSKVIGAALVAFLVLAVGIFEFYSLDSKLGKSNRTLTSTQTQLASARSDLAKVQASLQAANSKVRTLTKARDNLISSLHQTKAKLAKALSNLRGAKNNLSQAKNQIALQGGQIQTLKTCLGGVSVALNDVLNFNYNGAANALVSVESACQSAFQLLRS
jgi:septal ring factor EnvC (AmiA/AmiB activator)